MCLAMVIKNVKWKTCKIKKQPVSFSCVGYFNNFTVYYVELESPGRDPKKVNNSLQKEVNQH